MRTAEAVIVGGGVVGASVAYHLAARGVRDVLVLERGAGPGAGSTGRATGGLRAQFGTRVNVRLLLLSGEKLLRFEEETGVDPGFRQVGYLFVAMPSSDARRASTTSTSPTAPPATASCTRTRPANSSPKSSSTAPHTL